MPSTRQKPILGPRFTPDNLSDNSKSFFKHSSEKWCLGDFVFHFTIFGQFKFDIGNYKLTEALRSIEAFPTKPTSQCYKAQLLLNRHRFISVIKFLFFISFYHVDRHSSHLSLSEFRWCLLCRCRSRRSDGYCLSTPGHGSHTNVGSHTVPASPVQLKAGKADD